MDDSEEKEEIAQFWDENESLFEAFAQRLGECALNGDARRFGWYVSFLEKILQLGLQLDAKVRKAEKDSAHA